MNQTLTRLVGGSIDTYSVPEPEWIGNSWNVPVLGDSRKILSAENSVPQTSNWPDTDVTATPSGLDPLVGIVHSWKVPFAGSRCDTLPEKDSTNQQQFPEGSRDSPIGPLALVGTVHSVRVYVGEA